ncbi:hypothetical protein GJV85_12730 [Sulfurimonas aquatica]|uniref:Uncharacterized protein n=1 Tax=Sulfurimonas aquatica TaxID=2672570 RepID=A0A975GDQ7_9BACT|nr:hypothetical protein [Sulfurimonas aquatica]QSZ42935.1 hypothetical protein GJV85_12730 [Sulfurimonas aquatica]
MCNFNKQNEDTKMLIHLFMVKAADNVGGENYLLSLIEAMKKSRPNALMAKSCQIASNNTIIKWNKVVFKDKVDLLDLILLQHKSSENPDFNILNEENTKKRKNIINMVRALSPIEFTVTPQNPNDGGGFNFKVFESIEDDVVKLNPIFITMFFCSGEFIKKALRYKI